MLYRPIITLIEKYYYGLTNKCKLLHLGSTSCNISNMAVKYHATETNPVNWEGEKMNNNEKPSPQKRKISPRHNYIVQKESQNPDQPLEIPLKH